MSKKYLTSNEGYGEGVSDFLSSEITDTISHIMFGLNEKEDTKYHVQFRSAYGGISHKDSMEGAKPITDFHKALLAFKSKHAVIIQINFNDAMVDFRTRKLCVSVEIGQNEINEEFNIMAVHPSEAFFIDYDSDNDVESIKNQVKKAKMIGFFDGTVNDYR